LALDFFILGLGQIRYEILHQNGFLCSFPGLVVSGLDFFILGPGQILQHPFGPRPFKTELASFLLLVSLSWYFVARFSELVSKSSKTQLSPLKKKYIFRNGLPVSFRAWAAQV